MAATIMISGHHFIPYAKVVVGKIEREVERARGSSGACCRGGGEGRGSCHRPYHYFPFAVQRGSAISTRRFLALPSSVRLSAMGTILPYPLAVKRLAATPRWVSQATTARARASASVWL